MGSTTGATKELLDALRLRLAQQAGRAESLHQYEAKFREVGLDGWADSLKTNYMEEFRGNVELAIATLDALELVLEPVPEPEPEPTPELQLYEPEDGKRYFFGLTQGTQAYENLKSATGHEPVACGWFDGPWETLANDDDWQDVKNRANDIHWRWHPFSSKSWDNGNTSITDQNSLRSLARGHCDGLIFSDIAEMLAEVAKGKRIFLSPFWEFTGSWNGLSYQHFQYYKPDRSNTRPFNTATDFIDAWRRLKILTSGGTKAEMDAKLEAVGLAPVNHPGGSVAPVGAAFIWNPHRSPNPNTADNQAEDRYPGDEWVDWVGMDIYSRQDLYGGSGANAFDSTMSATKGPNWLYENYCIDGVHNKPMAHPECGYFDSGDAYATDFFNAFFAWMDDRPKVKMFSYFNKSASDGNSYLANRTQLSEAIKNELTNNSAWITAGSSPEPEPTPEPEPVPGGLIPFEHNGQQIGGLNLKDRGYVLVENVDATTGGWYDGLNNSVVRKTKVHGERDQYCGLRWSTANGRYTQNILFEDYDHYDFLRTDAGKAAGVHMEGIHIAGTKNITFRRCRFWDNSIFNVFITSYGPDTGYAENLRFEDCQFAAPLASGGGYDPYSVMVRGAPYHDVHFTNCVFGAAVAFVKDDGSNYGSYSPVSGMNPAVAQHFTNCRFAGSHAEIPEEASYTPEPEPEPTPEPTPEPPPIVIGEPYPRPVRHPDGSVSFRGTTWTAAQKRTSIGDGIVRESNVWFDLGSNDTAPYSLLGANILVIGGHRSWIGMKGANQHLWKVHLDAPAKANDNIRNDGPNQTVLDCAFDDMPSLSTNPTSHSDYIQPYPGQNQQNFHIVGNAFGVHHHRCVILGGGSMNFDGLLIRDNTCRGQDTSVKPVWYDIQLAEDAPRAGAAYFNNTRQGGPMSYNGPSDIVKD